MKQSNKMNEVINYIENLPEDKREVIKKLRQTILENLPEGFAETISYKMLGYVVPHSLYPSGYHCNPNEPLPFISIAAQKSHYAIYHMGLYADPDLMGWFETEYSKISNKKLDKGKSCLRFKKVDDIPFELIGELTRKITPNQWIENYEAKIRK